jgi:hypothetical protein
MPLTNPPHRGTNRLCAISYSGGNHKVTPRAVGPAGTRLTHAPINDRLPLGALFGNGRHVLTAEQQNSGTLEIAIERQSIGGWISLLGKRHFEFREDCHGGVRMHFQRIARCDLH